MKDVTLDTLVSLAKRRGFVFQASEIYGGLSGFYDYGPYGAQLKRNIVASWWNNFVEKVPNIFGIDGAIIQHPKLWEASGHIQDFNDPLVDCKYCKARHRADHVAGVDTADIKKLNELLKDKACPNCGKTGTFTEVRQFNMMFKTNIGPVEDESSVAYLRPETAGAIFTNFLNVVDTMHPSLPFGIAQVGKSFRNEISPREFIFRLRELEIMEIEYFIRPENANEEFKNTQQFMMDWLLSIGLDKKKLKWVEIPAEDRAHYSSQTFDIHYDFPFGARELAGLANRTDFDLSAHAKVSGKKMTFFDTKTNKHLVPHVIEPTFGLDRVFLATLANAYTEEKVKDETRVVLKLDPKLAPVKVAVLPLSKNDELTQLAHKVYGELQKLGVNIEYDETQSIGKRYRRQDEIGTPYCVTVDFDSLKDDSVTIRERDSMEQKRVKIRDLYNSFLSKIHTSF